MYNFKKQKMLVRAIAILLTMVISLSLSGMSLAGDTDTSGQTAQTIITTQNGTDDQTPPEPNSEGTDTTQKNNVTTSPMVFNPTTVNLMADASTRYPLGERQPDGEFPYGTLLREFEDQYDITVNVTYDSSGILLNEMITDPNRSADVFISADWWRMDSAVNAGIIDESTVYHLLNNKLVLVANQSAGLYPASLPYSGVAGWLTDAPGRTIAIGDPSIEPAGSYTWLVFDNIDPTGATWNMIADYAEQYGNVTQVLEAVVNDVNPIGSVYATDAATESDYLIVLDDRYVDIIYPIGITTAAVVDDERGLAAQELVDFLKSDMAKFDGSSIFKYFGFNGEEPSSIPGTPQDLTATVTTSSVTLTLYSMDYATGYDIEVDGTVIDNKTNRTYVHSGLGHYSVHTYRYRGKNFLGFGEWSRPLTVRTLPSTIFLDFLQPEKTNQIIVSPEVNGDNPGYDSLEYAWTETEQPPLTWTPYTGQKIELTASGDWYLHIKAWDSDLNETTAMFGPFNTKIAYQYDENNRLAGIKQANETIWEFNYDPNGNLVLKKTVFVKPPANLNVLSSQHDDFQLSWAPVEGADRYKVYIDGKYYTTVTTNSFTSALLEADKEYLFEVSAVAGNLEGEKAAVSVETTP